MTAKIELPNLDNIIRQYVAGETVQKLARQNGVSTNTIRRNMQAAGVYEDRRSHQAVIVPDFEPWIARYLAGESENALSAELGIGREAFAGNLRRHGIPRRDQSEAEFVKWSQMSDRERRQQVAAAHASTRGKPYPERRARLAAKTRERTAVKATAGERRLNAWLTERGFTTTMQKAVGRYNLDIAIHEPAVAVEVFGGGWHTGDDHIRRFPKRTKYILDQGWHVVIVWTDGRRYPLSRAAAEYIVGFCDFVGRDPAAPRQYRVILGDGQDAPALSSYLNSHAIVEALGCVPYVAGSVNGSSRQ